VDGVGVRPLLGAAAEVEGLERDRPPAEERRQQREQARVGRHRGHRRAVTPGVLEAVRRTARIVHPVREQRLDRPAHRVDQLRREEVREHQEPCSWNARPLGVDGREVAVGEQLLEERRLDPGRTEVRRGLGGRRG
jgi:hypothetical protein